MSEPHKTLGTPGGVGQPNGAAHVNVAPANEAVHPAPAGGTPTNGVVHTAKAETPAAGATNSSTQGAASSAGTSNVNSAPAGTAQGANSAPAGQTGQKMQFSSAQTSQAVKPKDYFGEQNAKRAKEKQASAKTRKRLLIILGAVIGVAVVALVTWLVVWLMQRNDVPTIANGTTEEIVDLRKVAQAAYNRGDSSDNEDASSAGDNTSSNDIEAAELVFDQALSTSSGSKYTNQILLSKMMFYLNNGYIDSTLDMINEIDVNALPLEQQAIFYDLASTASSEKGDNEAADRYWLLSYQISRELGNGGGGGA